jgi:uncharacterized repeat protein (TIGR01451 family)
MSSNTRNCSCNCSRKCLTRSQVCCLIKELKDQVRLYGNSNREIIAKVDPIDSLTIVKQVTDGTIVGNYYTWVITITVTNTSSNAINNITITDILNNGLTIHSTAPDASMTSTSNTAITTFNLNANSQYVFTISILVAIQVFQNPTNNFATLSIPGSLPKNSNTVSIVASSP